MYCLRMLDRIRGIAAAYGLKERVQRTERCDIGRIHQTWFAGARESAPEFDLVFQKMNTGVFRDVDVLMSNVSTVSRYLKAKLEQDRVEDRERRYLHLHHTLDGKGYFLEGDGSCWRVCGMIKQSHCHTAVESPDQAYQVACGYGRFISLLQDLPAGELAETIPDFHNTARRLKHFEKVVKADLHNRARGAAYEIAFIYEHDRLARVLSDAHKAGEVSMRVVHNDTKVNNVLLDKESHEAVCVIDLDTVMGGYSLNDFGDMARSITCTKAEDDHNWKGADIDIGLYKALVEGYLSAAGSMLSGSEISLMATSAMVLTYELAVRFLDDYLSGDHYFHVRGEQDNLYRARVQLELLRSMLRRRDEMESAV